jgi:hypothetical protein
MTVPLHHAASMWDLLGSIIKLVPYLQQPSDFAPSDMSFCNNERVRDANNEFHSCTKYHVCSINYYKLLKFI